MPPASQWSSRSAATSGTSYAACTFPRNLAAAGGLSISPASISPWQLAQTRTHFLASSRKAAAERPTAIDIAKDFVVGSTWWKVRLMMQRS